MAAAPVKRWRWRAWTGFVLLLLLLVPLHLMSDAVQNSAELSRLFVPLLAINMTGLVILVGLIIYNLLNLGLQYSRRVAGSRLTVRMVVLFAVLSLVPVSVVYYYSLGFIRSGIDSWFDVQIDQAMEDALELGKSALGLNQRFVLNYTRALLDEIEDQSETALALTLAELRGRSGATELTLIDLSGQVIAYSHQDPTVPVPTRPDTEIVAQARDGTPFVGLTPTDNDLTIRVLVRDPIGRPWMLQGIYRTSERIGQLSHGLTEAYNRYKELAYLRQSLKASFTLTLSLVLVFGLLSAIWAAFVSARKLVAPIIEIARGTRAVAHGDYDKQLPVPSSSDELGFLVASFNDMTRRIGLARDQAARSQREVEGQRAYLETVLGRLSSGVMAFDGEGRLRTSNPAAEQILQVDLPPHLGKPMEALAEVSPRLDQFVEAVRESLDTTEPEWRKEVTLLGGEGRQVLMCRATPFLQPGDEQGGRVLVFDDVTALIRAQRDAAWGEVARRLAHEIKNPLTPIQLSAERLRRKYLERMDPAEAEVLDRATCTIVNQVEAMKEMVNAFSEYARPPKMQPAPLEADPLIAEVIDLYRSAYAQMPLARELEADGARIEADPLRLRQLVHNLLANARDAVAGVDDPQIRVVTRVLERGGRRLFELRVQDNGPGFPDEVLGNLFEPYVTTKKKGTGLGLAIVKKIVEEHGGIIWAENCNQGACMIVQLPLLAEDSAQTAAARPREESR